VPGNETAVTNLLPKARRRLLAGLGLVMVATCVAGCEPANDFSITNATNQPLTVQERYRHPGEQPAPLSGIEKRFTLQPGAKVALLLDLSRGTCVDIEILAYDASGRLVDQDPTPICEDTHGHGNTWIITGK
jgi:hypothetical protein